MNTQTLELDLSKDGLGGNVVRVGQGDHGGTTIKAYIYDQGAEASLTGYACFLEVLLPNKRNYYRAAASVSGNVATATVDESKLCSVAGYTDEAYFTFEKSGAKYSTERFAIEILRSATDGQQPAQNWDDAIGDLIGRGNAAVSAANTAASGADAAKSAANAAASAASSAASTARGAAESATAAATNALNIANSIASIEPPSSGEVEELREANSTLATAVAELQDNYVIIKETAYMPTSRRTALTSETATVARASASGETATLG